MLISGPGNGQEPGRKRFPEFPLPPWIVYNRTASRAHEFQAKNPGTVVAESVQEAVSKSDIIFTCVGDDAAIKGLVKLSISSGDIKNKIFADCSTVHPDTTTSIAAQI
ncbi:hypothetical protein UA08_00858 [Talaromyces atroroseus]|uniref:6-phosphogluconate dehydrogenase NADP-binding domain-containing protein n=1 Tax=Talaromyces atroroseus TaxID=1441469 RepID=A0A225AS73_TALAT|nr:hypothetical protein UA08_00858 [Talaromyces atroroseus]OKL64422.1 hypothetical protein UA08_00858 [Talaromyces atroroseus]